jgi:pimeloyl-ACP methyl ester carboxylesterase
MVTFAESTRTIEVQGRTVHYNEAGEGPAFLGFHGGGPGANGWDNTKWNIDALSQSHRVLLVDLPGYGGSTPMEALEGETQDAMYARFLLAFLDAVGIDQAALYGTSMSGAPVVRFAHQHPERVTKLIMKSPGTVGFGHNLLSTSPPDGIMALGVFRDDPTRENMARMMHLFVPKPGLVTEEMIDARYQSALKALAMPQPERGRTEWVTSGPFSRS